jgi:DNA-binding NarL/FixJ family response regulator
MTRVILVDDHKIIRDGIQALLKDEKNIEVVGEAGNGEELLKLLEHTPADVVLMDMNMPVMDGFETTRHLKQHHPHLKVLVLTMLDSDRYVTKLIDAGASGYILKSAGKDELVHAIQVVSSGQSYICTEVSMALLRKMNSPEEAQEQKAGASLSKRELEVLKLIGEGFTNAQIADKLFTSKRTIESHRQNLIDKTNVKNTAALIKFAVSHGIIE